MESIIERHIKQWKIRMCLNLRALHSFACDYLINSANLPKAIYAFVCIYECMHTSAFDDTCLKHQIFNFFHPNGWRFTILNFDYKSTTNDYNINRPNEINVIHIALWWCDALPFLLFYIAKFLLGSIFCKVSCKSWIKWRA